MFAGYQPLPRIYDYQRLLLRGLHDSGFPVLLVDALDRPPDSPASFWEELKKDAQGLVLRPNVGWDFGSWYAGLSCVAPFLEEVDELVLLNDSSFGPLFPLAEAFDAMSGRECDFWGITDSYEKSYHLQSYFLVFRASAIRSAAFRRFFGSMRAIQTKDQAVERGELALTLDLMRDGLRPGVLCPYGEVAGSWLADLPHRLDALRLVRRPVPSPLDPLDAVPLHHVAEAEYFLSVASMVRSCRALNPTHYFWDALVRHHRSPFLKRDLLLKNPCHVMDLARVPESVADVSRYDLELIEELRKSLPLTSAPFPITPQGDEETLRRAMST